MDDGLPDLVREAVQGVLRITQVDIARTLKDLGWQELSATDPAVSYGILFEENALALGTSALLDVAVVSSLDAWDECPSVAFPLPSGGYIPSSKLNADTRTVEVSGLLLAAPSNDARVLVPALAPDGRVALTLVRTDQLTLTGANTIDHDWRPFWVDGVADVTGELNSSQSWIDAVANCWLAIAHELVGCTRKMLELGVAHVSSRQQFGRPIGSFQAVKHRMSDVLISMRVAELVLGEVVTQPVTLELARIARVAAGIAAQTATREVQQVLGGMGFTWEHQFRRFTQRAWFLQTLLGGTSRLCEELGAGLGATGPLLRLGSV